MGGYDETDDAEPCHPTSAISEVWAFEAIFSSRRVVCSNLSLNCPISSACFLIISSFSANISNNLSSTPLFLAAVAFSSSVLKSKGSPLPVTNHSVFTFASAHTFSITSKEGLPCLLPTMFSTTVAAIPASVAKALLFPPYKVRMTLPKRSFIVIVLLFQRKIRICAKIVRKIFGVFAFAY